MFVFADGKSNRVNLLSSESQERITVALSLLDTVITNLLSGDISVSLLKFITREKDLPQCAARFSCSSS